MQLDLLEGLGAVAGALGSLAATPQMIKILKTRHAGDVSALTFGLTTAGATLWLIYGIGREAPSLAVSSAVALLINGAVLWLKMFGAPRPAAHTGDAAS
ncbi:MAG: SemiSWEET family sugar transporter [Hyphomonadaceae bacterium]